MNFAMMQLLEQVAKALPADQPSLSGRGSGARSGASAPDA